MKDIQSLDTGLLHHKQMPTKLMTMKKNPDILFFSARLLYYYCFWINKVNLANYTLHYCAAAQWWTESGIESYCLTIAEPNFFFLLL